MQTVLYDIVNKKGINEEYIILEKRLMRSRYFMISYSLLFSTSAFNRPVGLFQFGVAQNRNSLLWASVVFTPKTIVSIFFLM